CVEDDSGPGRDEAGPEEERAVREGQRNEAAVGIGRAEAGGVACLERRARRRRAPLPGGAQRARELLDVRGAPVRAESRRVGPLERREEDAGAARFARRTADGGRLEGRAAGGPDGDRFRPEVGGLEEALVR